MLYTEMVTTGAIRHGSVERHMRFNSEEHPVALQLGGSDVNDLAFAAKLGEQWGYNEINLNCGCPSDRVQRGAFGACLMNEPQLVADGVKAMVDVVSVPVTVKHRIGIDQIESYDFVRDFVGTVKEAGCNVFIVHARNAWLNGLSPKENREIPPLRYELAYQLKKDFPQLTIAINGGITRNEQIAEHLTEVDGVMIGREAYYNPWLLTTWDETFFQQPAQSVQSKPVLSREDVEEAMVTYMERAFKEDGCPWYAIARHMLGLYHGQRGGRLWRQVWSNHKLKPQPPRDVMAIAREALARGAEVPA
jgi:tRNA-dihydrouridine synthase A